MMCRTAEDLKGGKHQRWRVNRGIKRLNLLKTLSATDLATVAGSASGRGFYFIVIALLSVLAMLFILLNMSFRGLSVLSIP